MRADACDQRKVGPRGKNGPDVDVFRFDEQTTHRGYETGTLQKPRRIGLSVEATFTNSSVRPVWSRLWSLQIQNGARTARRPEVSRVAAGRRSRERARPASLTTRRRRAGTRRP